MSGHRRWAVQPLDWRRWYSKINSYVVVVLYAKDDDFPCNGCYFLVYQFLCWYSRLPYRNRLLGIKCYSTYDSTYEHILVGILPEYLVSYSKYCSSTDIIFPAESSHWHHCCSGIFPYHSFNPLNHYLLIRSNRIITNIILFPNSPKHPVSDYIISK